MAISILRQREFVSDCERKTHDLFHNGEQWKGQMFHLLFFSFLIPLSVRFYVPVIHIANVDAFSLCNRPNFIISDRHEMAHNFRFSYISMIYILHKFYHSIVIQSIESKLKSYKLIVHLVFFFLEWITWTLKWRRGARKKNWTRIARENGKIT